MKKIITMLFGILLCASCNKTPMDIRHEITAHIDLSEMIKGVKAFKGINGPLVDAIPNEELDFFVAIHYIIYDKTGNLVIQDEKRSKSFSDAISFSAMLDEGEYTLVAWAYVNREIEKEHIPWKSINEDKLHTSKITTITAPVGFHILGIAKKSITVDKPMKPDLILQKAGAYYLLNFSFPTETTAKYFIISGYMSNNEYLIESGESDCIISNDIDKTLWQFVFDVFLSMPENTLTGLPLFLFPSKQKTYTMIWRALDEDFNAIYSDSISLQDVHTNENMVVNVDIQTGEFKLIPITP